MDQASLGDSIHIYTPSELNQEVKLHLEAGFPRILLEAEISNLSRPASGHLYFSLKDEAAQIRCAMFRTAAQRCLLQLANGSKVIARGRISLYEARGEYQFIVESLQDAGAGELQQKFERLKKALAAEGLFDPALKRPLPPYPVRIGVITSRSGAAIQDILHVLRRRWPVADVRLYAVAVQGSEAAPEIRAALARANSEQWAQVLILGRGGGSLEDLQAFNEESVARAVRASGIPVISAVGHETDFSICDFVADLRAPTPSAAAELATPDQAQLSASFARQARLLGQRMQGQLQRRMQGLDYLSHRLAQRDPALRLREQLAQLIRLEDALVRALRTSARAWQSRIGSLSTRLNVQHPRRKLEEYGQRVQTCLRTTQRLLAIRLENSRGRLQQLGRTLHAVSPLATMGRGYAVLFAAAEGTVIASAQQVSAGDRLNAQLADGRLRCTVDEVRHQRVDDDLAEAGNQPAPT
jgi:exodeoxyribonuclease VII large subunit